MPGPPAKPNPEAAGPIATASRETWDSFDWKRIPLPVARQAENLRDGSFLDRRENLLVFGKPGSGKTHCLCALAERLVHQGRSMLFPPVASWYRASWQPSETCGCRR